MLPTRRRDLRTRIASGGRSIIGFDIEAARDPTRPQYRSIRNWRQRSNRDPPPGQEVLLVCVVVKQRRRGEGQIDEVELAIGQLLGPFRIEDEAYCVWVQP